MTTFSLLLFSTNPKFIAQSVSAGVEGILVDWENIDKGKRQTFADTQINRDTLEDLRRVRTSTQARVICRINRLGETTLASADVVLAGGADVNTHGQDEGSPALKCWVEWGQRNTPDAHHVVSGACIAVNPYRNACIDLATPEFMVPDAEVRFRDADTGDVRR